MSPLSASKLQALLSAEALEVLAGWQPPQRRVFAELLEDAKTDLQREMLQRSLGAGRSLAELHAFADALRGMGDEQVFQACSLAEDSGLDDSVVDRLRAESDPLYAFTANGHSISPRAEDGDPGPLYGGGVQPRREVPAGLLVPPPDAPWMGPARKGFEEASGDGRASRADARDLGASAADAPSRALEGPSLGAEFLNEAVRALGVTYEERPVDGASVKLEKALDLASAALKRGVPVPVVLGVAPEQHLQYALLLQVQPAGAKRAFQMYDPLTRETVWANEGDLVGRTELPFSNKTLRRITAIALPKR